MSRIEMELDECPGCEAPMSAGAEVCCVCGMRKRHGNRLLHWGAWVLWSFTFMLGIFVLGGVSALIKHAWQDYTALWTGAGLFALCFALAWWLTAFNAANKLWRP